MLGQRQRPIFLAVAVLLVAWMVASYGFASEADALLLLGQVAEARATQIVNPKFTYLVKIAKRWLR